MAEKTLRQTTIRVDPEVLRKMRYFLDEERLSINDFVVRSMEAYLARKAEPTPRLEKQPA